MKNRTMVGAGVVAALACGLAFACGDTDETAPEDAGSAPDASFDSTSPDGALVDSSSPDGGTSDGALSDGGDAGETCPGPAGSLDPTFGDGGVVWLKYPGSGAKAVLMQPDGKILVAGRTSHGGEYLAVVRVGADGAPDSTFGNLGLAEKRVGTVTHVLSALALQPDGKIVAAGQVRSTGQPSNIAVVRLQPDGEFDPTFGSGGIVLTSYPGRDAYARSIALEATGKIVVAGYSEDATSPTGTGDFEVVRYNPNGSLDNSFGTAGKATLDIRGAADGEGYLALQGSRIVVGGASVDPTTPTRSDISTVALGSTGAIDPTFGVGGRFVSNLGADTSAQGFALVFDRSARLLIAGQLKSGGPDDMVVLRLTSSGVLDPSWADAGSARVDINDRNESAASVAVLPDDKIVIAGSSVAVGAGAENQSIALVRYLSNGRLDSTFGVGGKVLVPSGAPNSNLGAGAVVAGGCSIVTAGTWGYNLTSSPQSAMGIAKFRR